MGLVKLISRVFKFRPKWNGTPEMFLAVVTEMASRNNPDYSLKELLQWGDVMQKIMKVNLKPYRDFADLVARGTPDVAIVEKLKQGERETHQRRELKQAIYGPEADLGDDDLLKSDAAGAVFVRKMIKSMSEHVRFSEEEQRKIDEFDER